MGPFGPGEVVMLILVSVWAFVTIWAAIKGLKDKDKLGPEDDQGI